MPSEIDLLSMQRDFLRALREPIFGESRVATALARRAGKNSDAFRLTANRHLRPSATLQPVERLELYHRQYWYRLLDSLAEDFPVLQQLLGLRRFWSLAEAYLEATPSRSYTLRHLGSGLADFILANPDCAGRHPHHASELARLEYALCLAFEAAEQPTLPVTELDHARLQLQPHVQLFALRTNAGELWRRTQDGKAIRRARLAAPSASPTHFVAVFRQHLRPQMETLEPDAFRLLARIQRGGTLNEILETTDLEATPDILARVQSWFARWTELDWLAAKPSI